MTLSTTARGPDAPPLRVLLRAGQQIHELSNVPVIVPSGRAVLMLPVGVSTARLDGVEQAVVADGFGPGLVPVDLTRSTGFHRLVVQGRTFWFGTEDAKLSLDGVEQMLNHLQGMHAGTAWGGQILFSSGGVLRDAHVVYGWLDAHGDAAIALARAILARPLWGTQTTQRMSRFGGPGVNAPATHRLLRSDPQRLLQKTDDGMLTVGKHRYLPLRVVVRDRKASIRTASNLRLVALMTVISRLATEVRDASDDAAVQQRCIRWQEKIAAVQRRPLFREIQRGGVPPHALSAPRAREEFVDARHREVFGHANSLVKTFGWQATREPLSRFTYVDYADQIYQAFVGVVVASALGCDPVDSILGRAPGVSFTSESTDIYIDRTPPRKVLRSWRSRSSTPDQLRPDLLIHRRTDGRVLLLDAKYRASGNRATEDSRKEVLAYMAAYGLSTAVIAYPPRDPGYAEVTEVEGYGQRLIELPVAPRPGLESSLSVTVPRLLDYLAWGQYK